MKFNFRNELETVTLQICDTIGENWDGSGITRELVVEQLENANSKPLNIHINSYGGEVFEGFAIYNAIKNYKGSKTVYIDGIAASIASVIALAGDKVIMNKASMFMIHNASGGCYGTAEEMKKVVEALEQINTVIRDIYLDNTNIDEDKLKELMENETFLTPNECIEYGFCDEVLDEEPAPMNGPIDNLEKVYSNRLKQIKDLKEALKLLNSDVQNEGAFFNKETPAKENHYNWIKF